MKKIKGHLVDTVTKQWFHYDENYNLWTCSCGEPDQLVKVDLCLSQCQHLQDEGKYRELKREIAQKRKELGLLVNKEE